MIYPSSVRSLIIALLCALLCALLLPTHSALAADKAVADRALVVPTGFTIQALDFAVPGARQMALSSQGTLFVGTMREGSVYAVANALTAKPGPVREIATDLNMPSGLALHKGDLFVGALNRVLRLHQVESTLRAKKTGTLPFTILTDSLPSERHHGWKYLGFGPDDLLYLPVGAPCNICLSKDPRFASILRMQPSGGATEIVAHGVRNSVGFDWHPTTGELWFSDNGRDRLGDDLPAEEINRVSRVGEHFGYPFIHAGDIKDPEFGSDAKPEHYQAPQVKIQAHSAALGMTFYTGKAFPATYQGALFVAEHGSWNRSSKVGYRVSVVRFAEGKQPVAEPFAQGWLQGQENWGRPNDVLVTHAGDLLIADDQGGVIYRVSYDSSESTIR